MADTHFRMPKLSTDTKKPGRRRRVTVEQVIGAACEIGLDRLDMGTLAQKLGIGVATLYGYVDSRDHLLQLVAARLASSNKFGDHGQSWEEALRAYAATVFQNYMRWPQLIMLQIQGLVGDPTEYENTNELFKFLISRGFTPPEAMEVYSQIGQIAGGAALAAICYNRLRDEAGGDAMLAAKWRASCAAKGFSAMQSALESVSPEKTAVDFKPSLERLIVEQAARMKARTIDSIPDDS